MAGNATRRCSRYCLEDKGVCSEVSEIMRLYNIALAFFLILPLFAAMALNNAGVRGTISLTTSPGLGIFEFDTTPTGRFCSTTVWNQTLFPVLAAGFVGGDRDSTHGVAPDGDSAFCIRNISNSSLQVGGAGAYSVSGVPSGGQLFIDFNNGCVE